jgi:hypothetical protein
MIVFSFINGRGNSGMYSKRGESTGAFAPNVFVILPSSILVPDYFI